MTRPSALSRNAVCLSVCSTAGCHRFPLNTHWIVILLQARSEVRAGQGRTQKAGHVTTVPVVFAELRPGLRHGDKDDPTLPLPMWLHSVGPSFPPPAQLILFRSLTLRSLPPESLSSSLFSAPSLFSTHGFFTGPLPVYDPLWGKDPSYLGLLPLPSFFFEAGETVCLTLPVSNLQDGAEHPHCLMRLL